MDQEIFHCAHTLTMVFLNIYNDEKDEKKTRIVPFPIIKNLYYKNSYIYICVSVIDMKKIQFSIKR